MRSAWSKPHLHNWSKWVDTTYWLPADAKGNLQYEIRTLTGQTRTCSVCNKKQKRDL